MTRRRRRYGALLLLGASSSAAAHGVPGDADPGKTTYVLPGIVGGIGSTTGKWDLGMIDVGLEVSAHRFVPSSGSILGQPGYGALVQVEIAGVSSKAYSRDAPGFRGALGAQVTLGVFGLQSGAFVRSAQGPFAGSTGLFAATFVSFGIFSGGISFDLPAVDLGSGAGMPLVVGWMFTGKWPLPIEDRRPASRDGT